MLNFSRLPLALEADGVKLYGDPTLTEVGGLPEMLSAFRTVIVKGASATLCVPSLTLITMPEYVPAWLAAGVPESMPLPATKLAQTGRFLIEKVSALPFGALVVGWNE